jgi:hypothetical protein
VFRTHEYWRNVMTDGLQEEAIAPFLVLLIGKLLNWADVPKGGGDPLFLTGAQAEALAAEGIKVLTRYLPPEAAKAVTTAVAPHARASHRNQRQALMRVGALGGVLPKVVGSPENPPGCCVYEGGQLICVR